MDSRWVLFSVLLILLVAIPSLGYNLPATVEIPSFSDFTIKPSQPEVGGPVNVTVKVYEEDPAVTAYLIYPNGTTSESKEMFTPDNRTYNTTFNASMFGTHTVKIVAENSKGTSTTNKKFGTKITLPPKKVNVTKGNTTTVLNNTHTAINVNASEAGEATVNAIISSQPDGIGLKEANRSTGGSDKGIKYLNITSHLKNISAIRIDIRYTDDEVKEVDENTLAIFYYNGTRWLDCNHYVNQTIPDGPLVIDAGNNPDRNYAYAVVNKTSHYSLGGNYSPPPPVTGLKADSRGQTQIKWSWNDPQNPDLSQVMVYIDGEFKRNVTKGIQNYLATEFSPGSEHTISTRTVDTTALLSNWNNNTARTSIVTTGGGGGGGGGFLPFSPTPTPTPVSTAETTPTRSIPVLPSTPVNIETATERATEITPTPTPSPAEPEEPWWQQPTLTITLATVAITALVILLYAVKRE